MECGPEVTEQTKEEGASEPFCPPKSAGGRQGWGLAGPQAPKPVPAKAGDLEGQGTWCWGLDACLPISAPMPVS